MQSTKLIVLRIESDYENADSASSSCISSRILNFLQFAGYRHRVIFNKANVFRLFKVGEFVL